MSESPGGEGKKAWEGNQERRKQIAAEQGGEESTQQLNRAWYYELREKENVFPKFFLGRGVNNWQ